MTIQFNHNRDDETDLTVLTQKGMHDQQGTDFKQGRPFSGGKQNNFWDKMTQMLLE